MAENTEYNLAQDEISLKDLILRIGEYWRYLLRKWQWLLLAGALGLLIGAALAIYSPTEYIAEETFMVSEDEGGGGSGLSSAISMFGLGSIRGGKYNYDKVVSLAKSKRVVMAAFLDTMENSDTLVANRMIDVFEVEKKMEQLVEEGYRIYIPNRDIENFSIPQRKIMNKLYNILCGEDGIFRVSYDENSKIFTTKINSPEEALSYNISRGLYNHLNKFYTYQATNKHKENLRVLEEKLDSVKILLSGREYALASERDKNAELFLDVDRVNEGRLMRDVQISGTAYGELLKNYETARFTLASITPTFTPIDSAEYPLKKEKKSWIKQGIIGAILAGFLCVLFLILRKFMQGVMRED